MSPPSWSWSSPPPGRTWLALLAALPAVLACPSRPVDSGPAPSDAGREDGAAAQHAKTLWKGTRVMAGVGDVHNILPEEKGIVRALVAGRVGDMRKCFEEPVRRRGCRTNGLPASFDAMLMIADDGAVREVRIVPNRNDMPRECHGAVSCVQDAFAGVRADGFSRFRGARQAYMTVTVVVPDEADLDADGASGR